MLKADIHIHTSEDPQDLRIKYSAKEFISQASKLGFNILSITNHNVVTYSTELSEYAKNHGILLIPGIEAVIKGKEILLININKEAESIKTFSQLREYKKRNPDILIIAPHPFYPKTKCLRQDLIKNIDLFDGIEYSHCYGRFFNPFNRKASALSVKYNKPLVGTSDSHNLFQFNKTYTLVKAKMNTKSVVKAIRTNKIEIKTKPLSYLNIAGIMYLMLFRRILRFQRKVYKQILYL